MIEIFVVSCVLFVVNPIVDGFGNEFAVLDAHKLIVFNGRKEDLSVCFSEADKRDVERNAGLHSCGCIVDLLVVHKLRKRIIVDEVVRNELILIDVMHESRRSFDKFQESGFVFGFAEHVCVQSPIAARAIFFKGQLAYNACDLLGKSKIDFVVARVHYNFYATVVEILEQFAQILCEIVCRFDLCIRNLFDKSKLFQILVHFLCHDDAVCALAFFAMDLTMLLFCGLKPTTTKHFFAFLARSFQT